MATLKAKEIGNMGESDIEKKMKELKMALVKSRSGNAKSGKTKEIKKIIARMLTLKSKGDKTSEEVEKHK